jgi:hypothetical protein
VSAMLDAAFGLAAAGWKVFPCIPRGPKAKAPYKDVDLGLENGHLDASDDPELIEKWWTRWPDAMIGAVVPESLLVIDIDPRHGGSRRALEHVAGPLPITLTVWSGRNDGGCHFYFLRPAGPLTSTRLPTGIDLKVNGYCIMPPSRHPATGQPYRWELHEPMILPYRLRELLRPPPRRVASSSSNRNGAGLVRTVAEATEGNRNTALFWACCRAAQYGLLDHIEEDLIAAAAAAGLTEREARATVASARRAHV